MQLIRTITISLGALGLVVMMGITVAEVVMRYVFRDPIFGAAEMIQKTLGLVVFAGMFAVTRDRGHVTVSVLGPFLSKHFGRGYRGLIDAITVVGLAAVAGILGWRLWDLTHYPEASIVLRLPMIWITGAMAALAAVALIAALSVFGTAPRKTPPNIPPHPSDEA